MTALGPPDVARVTPPPVFGDPRVPARIWRKITVDPVTGCWLWCGYRASTGYGQTGWQGKTRLVHRVVFLLLGGEIPPSLQLDHRCRVRRCCHPAHLDVVSPRTNTLRGVGPSALNARKTHCTRGGHPLSGPNLRIERDGRRKCRTCHRADTARWRAKRKAETAEPSTAAKIIGTNLGTHGIGTLTPGRMRTNGPQQPAA